MRVGTLLGEQGSAEAPPSLAGSALCPLTALLSAGLHDSSTAAGGHPSDDPQLLLHYSQPAHHHAPVPAPGQHHTPVHPVPGTVAAIVQLQAEAAAKVSRSGCLYPCPVSSAFHDFCRNSMGGRAGKFSCHISPCPRVLAGPTATLPSTGARWPSSGCRRRRLSGGNRSRG